MAKTPAFRYHASALCRNSEGRLVDTVLGEKFKTKGDVLWLMGCIGAIDLRPAAKLVFPGWGSPCHQTLVCGHFKPADGWGTVIFIHRTLAEGAV